LALRPFTDNMRILLVMMGADAAILAVVARL
jgi:hypothetical protein